jgi:hypothetical protein
MILKFKDKNFINKLKNSQKIELRIPLEPYLEVAKMPLDETLLALDKAKVQLDNQFRVYHLDSRILNFYGNLTNSKRSGEEEFYLFARYEDLLSSKNENDLKTAFKSLVEKTKTRFDLELTHLGSVEERKGA